jgi:hypothetical protein
MEYKALLNILNPIRMPPTTLAEDSLNNRHQSCASRIYISPLVLWKKERPSGDPVRSSIDNLQKGRTICIVKYNIIPAISDCPNQSTNSNSYSCFGKFVDLIQPISKHIFYIIRGRNIESEMNNSPDRTSEFAFKKEVFYGLFPIIKGAFFLHPVQFLLAKMSFVRISFLFKNHMKILIFSGTLIF